MRSNTFPWFGLMALKKYYVGYTFLKFLLESKIENNIQKDKDVQTDETKKYSWERVSRDDRDIFPYFFFYLRTR